MISEISYVLLLSRNTAEISLKRLKSTNKRTNHFQNIFFSILMLLQPGVPAFTSPQPESAMAVLQERADERNVRRYISCYLFYWLFWIISILNILIYIDKYFYNICIILVSNTYMYHKSKRKRSDSVLWQKPLHGQTNIKSNVTTQKRHQKYANITLDFTQKRYVL